MAFPEWSRNYREGKYNEYALAELMSDPLPEGVDLDDLLDRIITDDITPHFVVYLLPAMQKWGWRLSRALRKTNDLEAQPEVDW